MYSSDTEILFPMRVAPQLRDLRGALWQATVDRAVQSQDADREQLAFSLVMIRLAGCLTCYPDCYRAMRGCTLCAKATVRRFRGEDHDLVALIDQAGDELDGAVDRGQGGPESSDSEGAAQRNRWAGLEASSGG